MVTSNDLEELMAQAMEETPADSDLARVAAVARKQWVYEQQVEEAEKLLEERKKLLNEVRDKELPDLMQEVGMAEFKLDNGYKVTVKNEVYCSIPEDPEPAFAWLRENGFGAIIKNFVSVAFGKGEDEIAKSAVQALVDLGLQPEIKTSVHPSTLKAFIKEQMAKGIAVPLESFGAYAVNRSKIDVPKRK